MNEKGSAAKPKSFFPRGVKGKASVIPTMMIVASNKYFDGTLL
jgi:hypothetical protein